MSMEKKNMIEQLQILYELYIFRVKLSLCLVRDRDLNVVCIRRISTARIQVAWRSRPPQDLAFCLSILAQDIFPTDIADRESWALRLRMAAYASFNFQLAPTPARTVRPAPHPPRDLGPACMSRAVFSFQLARITHARLDMCSASSSAALVGMPLDRDARCAIVTAAAARFRPQS